MAKNQFAELIYTTKMLQGCGLRLPLAERDLNKCGSAKFYATKKLGSYSCGDSVCSKDSPS